ncbi:MAG: NAD(P)H-dependent oxidoreductase [Thaumarchaeota archaeon]|nr:NAD(P)H-dependent oxidoreductase [Nitrososphaerota archaeon]
MTLQESREIQKELQIAVTGLSGSRRRNGNTKFLLQRALGAGAKYVDEINEQLALRGTRINLTLVPKIFETHFDDHDEIVQSVGPSNAILLASPVYFGSISPTLNELLREVSNDPSIDLQGKAAGSIAVGTQRNGGQETAIEDFWRWYLDRNITFLGNGPVTSQYGGTAWGGGRLTARRDVYGISTTMGAGKRLIQDALVRSTGMKVVNAVLKEAGSPALGTDSFDEGSELKVEPSTTLPSCRFLIFSDVATPSRDVIETMNGIERAAEEFAETAHLKTNNSKIDFLSLEEDMKSVKDCAACAICPPGNQKIPGVYACIYDDDLNRNFHRFYESSAIICSTQEKFGLVPPKYWRTLNRMRSVRRNDYMLTGRMGSVIGGSSPASQIPLKWLVRNNLSILASSRENHFEFGKLLFRETLLRQSGMKFFEERGVNIWTRPTHHE